MAYNHLSDIERIERLEKKSFYQIVLEDDMQQRQVSAESSLKTMRAMYTAMKEADRSYEARRRSASGLSGGDGAKLERAVKKGTLISGDFIGTVMEKAVKMAESNACMKRIVAAPTAGSCGVLPAVLLTYASFYKCDDNRMVEALYVASGIGAVIAENASIAGAQGGCQAEIGSGSAMAAGALTYLRGGDAKQINNAAALALKGLLGLVCDPVGGLVEIPCIKRNVIGSVNAVTASDMTIAGIKSAIPADEVIDAMKNVGKMLPDALKETACGGLAVTPTAKKLVDKIKK